MANSIRRLNALANDDHFDEPTRAVEPHWVRLPAVFRAASTPWRKSVCPPLPSVVGFAVSLVSSVFTVYSCLCRAVVVQVRVNF